jgi:hypothetical protein
MKRTLAVSCLLALVIALAVCGGGGKTVSIQIASGPLTAITTSPTTATGTFDNQCRSDVAPVNAAVAKLGNDPSITAAAVVAYGKACELFAQKLLQQAWPADNEANVHALASAAQALAVDVKQRDASDFYSGLVTVATHAAFVAADLGLPPTLS